MEDIMITSGTSFEGYEISEYGPYRFVQTILSSNFLKEIGSSIADIATDRSSIYQEKLDGAMNEAIKSFKEMAGKTKYNAVVGEKNTHKKKNICLQNKQLCATIIYITF